MPHCVASGCNNKPANTKGTGVRFHRFPKNPVRCKAWVREIRRKDWAPSIHSRLCSSHFEEGCYQRQDDGSLRLSDSAVPTVFPFNKKRTIRKYADGGAGPSFRPTVSTAVSDMDTNRCTQVGDADKHNYAVTASPRTLKRTIDQLCDQLDCYKVALKSAKKSIRRLKTKMSGMASVIHSLRDERPLSHSDVEVLGRFRPVSKDISFPQLMIHTFVATTDDDLYTRRRS